MKLDKLREAYSKSVLQGEAIPADIAALLGAMARNEDFADSDDDPLAHLGCMLILPGDETPAVLSHAYLNNDDRANAEIMANVVAMDRVNALCCFVAASEDDEVYGYFRGADKLPLSASPIIMLDNEGQYRHLPGKTLAEAICSTIVDLPERYERARTCFARLSVDVPAIDAMAATVWPAGLVTPGALREKHYAENRAKAGL